MTYIEDNLLPNEVINYEGKVHSFYKVGMIIGMIIGLLFLIPAIQVGGAMWLFGFSMMVVFGYQLLFILTTEIVVSNRRVLYKTGVIARNVFELQLNKVESVRLDQTIFERIIGAGTLIISGTGGHNKPIKYLASPIDMKTIIYQEIEKYNS